MPRAVLRDLARVLQPGDDIAELVGGAALGVFVHCDRRSRLLAPPFRRLLLFLSAASLGAHDVEPARRARVFLGGMHELRLEQDDGLLVLVLRVDRGRDRGLALGHGGVERGEVERHAVQLGDRHGDLLAESLRFAARLEDASRILPGSTLDEPASAKHFARHRRDRHAHAGRKPGRDVERLDDQRFPDEPRHGLGLPTGGGHDTRQRARARGHRHGWRRMPARQLVEHDEAAMTRAVLGGERERVRHVPRAIDDDVLQEVAQERVDRALERTFDLEMVGDGAVRRDRPAGFGEQEPRAVPERRAARVEALKRLEMRFMSGEIPLPRRNGVGEQEARCPLRRQRGIGRGARRPRGRHRVT